MYGYGISAALDDERGGNRVLKVQGRRLLDEGGLETLAGRLELDGETPAEEWSRLAGVVAEELTKRGFYPLGVDAPLSVADDDGGRPFESLVGTAAKTPDRFDPWPSGQDTFLALARLWTEVGYLLVQEHGWTLWTAQERISGSKLLVEVYPRLSWATFGASQRIPIEEPYTRVALRDALLDGLDLRSPGELALNASLRDSAICAATAGTVAARAAGFLGRPAEPDTRRRVLTGGGIAVPWTVR